MIYKLGAPGFGRYFTVPCAAVDNYLKLASGDFYKILLSALCSDGGVVDTDELAARCGVERDVAEDAMLFWSVNGVISLQNADGQPQNTISAAQKPVKAKADESAPDNTMQTPKAPQRSHVRYSPKELARKAGENKDLQTLYDEIQKIFGRTINATDSASLVDIYEYYGFDAPSIIILAQYCADLGKTRMAYMQAVAREWYERGICTYSQIEQEIVRLSKRNELDSRIAALLGIELPLTKSQKEYFARWTEWGFGEKMIALADEVCRDRKNKTDIRYINGILKRWNSSGIKTEEQVKASEDAYKKAKEASSPQPEERSYDLNKWHELDDSIDLDTLSFEEVE